MNVWLIQVSLFLSNQCFQVSEDLCVIDGTVDGLSPGLHGLNIHELGDLSQGCSRLEYANEISKYFQIFASCKVLY